MNKYLLLLLLLIIINSCQKEAGEGGQATIYGKVYVKDYNNNFTILKGEYYAPDKDVYIIYGNNRTYNDRTKTSYDGTYQFSNLRKGKYKIYVYSKDSTATSPAGIIPIIKEVEITKRHEEYNVPDIIIFD
ncbi:MAG TPA: hypothetical protein P5250_08860 [Bacteroidales bacterium]|nr:hypothetical protein [Bacteroidales bacterium]